MASTQFRFSDQRYLNWLKDTLSLLYLKEGIEIFVDAEAVRFHTQLHQSLGVHASSPQTCLNSCTPRCMTKDFRRHMWHMTCPLCNSWLQQLVQNHSNQPLPTLHTGNTNPQLWPTHPWETLKLYMPFGCQGNQSAKDCDAQGILSLFKNCLHFSNCGRIGRVDLIEELLRIRNCLFHSGKFQVEDANLQADMQTMLDFLRGMTSLSPAESQSVQQAVDKIIELQTNNVDLSLNKELELRALQQKQNAIANDLKRLEHGLSSTSEKVDNTEDDVKAVQRELNTTSANLTVVDSDVKTLHKDVASVTAKTTTLEIDVKTLTQKTNDLEQRILKLQGVQDLFNKFLQANGLERDIALLSTTTQQHGQRIQRLENQIQEVTYLQIASTQQGNQINKQGNQINTQGNQISTLCLRQQELDLELQSQRSQLQAHEHTRSDHDEKLKNERKDEDQQRMTESDLCRLQTALIQHYREHCLLVSNPVVAEELGLEEVYVNPDIKVLRETKNPRRGLVNMQNRTAPANTPMCKQLFYTENYKSKQIYITGDAGMGKSIFCKHLVNLWCDAHSDIQSSHSEKSDSDGVDSENEHAGLHQHTDGLRQALEENRKVMSDFNLLFYIMLRDSAKQYNVTEMVDSQILHFLKCTKSLTALDILQKEECLVIIDGLDEWACPEDAKVPHFINPGLPGRLGLNRNNVYLTTTRPWKFDILKLKSSEVDKHVELTGLNNTSSNRLCSKIIKLLNEIEGVGKTKERFWTELNKKGLDHFHNVPVILTQLVCLWFDKQALYQSQIQLYSSMLEMLLKRAVKNLSEQTCAEMPENDQTETLLPMCFSTRSNCQAHQHLLLRLSKVAFEALFDEKRENALVFESAQMRICGVSNDNILMGLKSGILSQNKVLGKWSVSEKKLSFLHKKLQEFLAALFIISCESAENVITRIRHFCSTVETMLEMSQVWMFVSGIRPDLARQLLIEWMIDVVSTDVYVKKTRQTFMASSGLLQSIQTCIVDCVVEARQNGHHDFCLPLEDFIITETTISQGLDYLLESNIANVKSVYIDTGNITNADVKTLERMLCLLKDTHCVHKLYLNDPDCRITDTAALCRILVKNQYNLTCLELSNITLTTELFAAVCGTLKHLMALNLFCVRLSHEQREQLTLLSQTGDIRQLGLWYLQCIDHGKQCRPVLDLSGHKQLSGIHLLDMHVEKLPVVSDSVRNVYLAYVTIAERQLRTFIYSLSSTIHMVTVELIQVTVTGDGENSVDLTDLRHNKMLVVTLCEHDDTDNIWRIKFHKTADDH